MSVTMLNEGREVSAGAPPSRRTGYDSPFVANRGHWNKVFTDQDYFDSIAKQKGVAEAAKVSPFGDDYAYRQAMIGYMADTRKVPLEDMRAIYDAEKDSFAKKMLGKQTITSRELFDYQKQRFERENEKEQAARKIMDGVIQRSLQDALSGGDTPFVESVAKDIDAASDYFDDEEKSRLWEKAEELDIKVRAAQSKFAPEASFIFSALSQQANSDQGFESPDMQELAGRFSQLPDNQRRAIYELAGSFAQLNQTNKGFWYQMAESLGRGTATFTEAVPRNFKEQSLRGDLRLLTSDQPVFKAGESYSAAGTTPITPEEREQAKADIQKKLGVFKVERELRDLAERVIDPIKTVTFLPSIVEEGLYGAAQSIPYTAAAAVPYAGIPAVTSALFSSNYDRIMLEYPDVDPDKAALLAAISAPIEAGLERMKVNTITGRLPIVGGLVKRLQHPNQRNLTRILIGGAGVLAEQNAQEILQNATFPLVQTIGAALDQDIPQYKLDLASIPRDLAVQFVALLPLSLMGIGALSYREIKRGENYLTNKDNLGKAGFSQEQIDAITGSATPDEAQDKLREEYAKRDPKLVKAAAQRIMDESIALRERANPAALPRLEKQGADYVVLSPEGKELARSTDQTAAEQALVSARRETVQREMRDVHTGINEAMQFIQGVSEARQRGEDVATFIRDNSPRTLLTDYEANPTQQNLDQLFETVRFFGQEINDPAELANFPVTGSNQGELREGIWRSIIRINDGADATIVMREFAQDNLKRALAENRVTMDWVRQQLNEVLPQIDSDRIKRRLRTETDTDVIEAFSDVAVAYFRGSIREEQIPAGLRGVFRRLAIIARDIFRRAYNLARLRAEGKLDRDFEALLAEAVGVNQQALVDRARERTEQEVGAQATAQTIQNYSITFADSNDRVTSYHLTDNPNFVLDKARKPQNNTTFGGDWPDAGIFVGPSAERWFNGYGYTRPFVVELSHPPVATMGGKAMAEGGYGGEMFIPAEEFDSVKVERVIPYDEYVREEFGGYGPVETYFDLDAEGNALPPEVREGDSIFSRRDTTALKNYRYSGKDVREMSPEQQRALAERTAKYVSAERPQQNYSIGISPAMDADYLAAVERGDMETAQRMVDEAARRAGYDVGTVYHGTNRNFNKFSKEVFANFNNAQKKLGFFFTPEKDYAQQYGGRVINAYLRGNFKEESSSLIDEIETDWTNQKAGSYVARLKREGFDGVIFDGAPKEIAVFNPSQIKSADPVTYDAKGNVIPLSQRFDATTPNINYSIVRSVDHFKNDTRFDKLVKDGRVFTGVDVNDFIDQHILLHSPDNAFAGTIQLTDGGEIKGKGGVYYPALYADDNYFWASTEAMVMRTANHLNEIGAKNGGRILMGLVSAPVEKLFSSTSMSTGVVKFLNALTNDPRAGLRKSDLNTMLVAASKVEVVKKEKDKPDVIKTFKTKLKASDSYATNFGKIDALLEPNNSVFQVRKAFVESLADQIAKHLNATPATAEYVAGILADAENKHAKNAIKRGKLSKASFLQGLGNMLTEPFLRDFQEHGNGKIYAIVEVEGRVKGIATTEHESYPATIVPENQNSKVKLHVLKEAVDWQDVVGKETGQYATPQERLNLLPTSGMSSTNLKVLGVKAGSNAAPLDYSISTQSEIDRVSAAMGALDRSPLDRVKIYEKMQERFLRVMSDNRETLAAMEGDLSQVRRTQILQALGELDGIISALPAEIRSKIGGYTQLAKVDPMDVFKGDQKVSEVRGMSGAIISAWMREGLNIGEAQKKTELPAGYRAERNLDPARADRAIADVFIQRINRINEVLENFLRDEYNDAAVELFKRAKPQRSGAGEKPKGKLGADVHELFDTLKEATEWSAVKASAEADKFIAMAESGELDPYEEAHAFLAAQVVPLFADWANADSSQRAAAVTMGKEILDRAYRGEQQRILAMRQKRGYDRTDLSDDAGVAAADDKTRQEAIKRENSLPAKWEAGMLNLLNFDQVLSYIFGRDSKVSTEIVNRQRKADNEKSDGIAKLSDEWAAFLTQLGGGETEGQRLMFDLSRMDDDIDGVPYSQNQLMAITMMWMQPKGRQHMEGFFDSDGNPSGNWHYNQEFVNKAEGKLRPEAKAIREYLLRKYDEEYDAINKVYRKVYGLNLPKNQFYSPLSVEPIKAPQGASVDPVTGAVFAAGANSPSALRSRGGAIAQPVFRDAVQTYFAHMLQMEHWKAYAQFNSEVTAILGHRDTRMVVKGKAGEQAATVLNNWLQYFLQGGNKDAANHLAINQWIGRMTSNFAAIALFGRLSTLALQTTQLGAASAKMPVGAYLSRFGKLMSGRLGWKAAIDSDYIQRRVKDMPPAVAIAMQGLRAEKPNAIRNAAKWLGQQLSGFDGLFTAGTYAIVYDYQLSQARQNGMSGKEAEDFAHAETERIVDEIAQPTRAGARSIYELNMTNPVARAVWAFSSESRKNMGLLMYTGAKGGGRNFGKALAYVMLLNGLVGIVIRNAFRDMRDDDDEEIFDEKNWGWSRMAAMFISDPIYGIPVVGETIESGVYAAFGVYQPSGPVFDVARGVPAAKRMLTQYPAEVLEGDADFRDIVADVNRILATAGLFNSTIAGAASISNLVRDIYETGDNALGE